MVINKNDFRQCKELLIRAYEKGGIDEVRFLCVVSHINLIAAFSLILEEHQDVDLEEAIVRLCKFYRVKEIK